MDQRLEHGIGHSIKKLLAVEMSYLRGACRVTRWEGDSSENMYKKCGMGPCANVVKCDVVEWVKRNTLRWFGHLERERRVNSL